MKQVIQSARTGELAVKDVPRPSAAPGEILVETRASLISAGTERMVTDFAAKSLAGKARARPDLVKKVIAKAKTDGLAATARAVRARLDEPLALGYSAAGRVVELGDGAAGAVRVGERVAIAGAGAANHAEFNAVPRNLAVPVPDAVSDEEAAFATVAAIALHAVRNLDAKLGETVAVIGAGLVGQIALQILRLSGVRALALDYDAERLALAERLGAEKGYDLGQWDAAALAADVEALTRGIGCDGILIAAATDSAEPFETAAMIARDRARVCLVGLTGTAFPFADFMRKELNIVVSRSYGPGRYDADYEDRGLTYPEGYVRWTETENLAEVLRLIAAGGLDVKSLITHRFAIEEAGAAYALLGADQPSLGVLITYPGVREAAETRAQPRPAAAPATGVCSLGVVGAGQFARAVLLPALKQTPNVQLKTVVARTGANAEHAQANFGFERAETDAAAILDDPSINAVLIATRHDSHADLAARALNAGKAVYVEKPLGLTFAEIDAVQAARDRSAGFLQVGYNRRFAPASRAVAKELARHAGPRNIVMRVNAGRLPADHWSLDAREGGGRLIGEGCHFMDLARFLAGAPIRAVTARGTASAGDAALDDVTLTLDFADGSLATIVYTALGDAAYPKESVEVFAGGAVAAIDNFRGWRVTAGGREQRHGGRGQDKGHAAALAAFAAAVAAGGPAPVDEAELFETSRATLAAAESLRTGAAVEIAP